MKDLLSDRTKAAAERTERGIAINKGKGLTFHLRCSSIVNKPTYAAKSGNIAVVNDK
jgi:hypothetical protein